MIETTSPLWIYLSPGQQELARDGQLLIDDRINHPNGQISDYSYLVFPYAKLYEGFLKQLFRDLGIITENQYQGEHFRVGKVLSPTLARVLGKKSAYTALAHRFGDLLAQEMWQAWKIGRNTVFHYFPHNIQRLTYAEAKTVIAYLISVMEKVVETTGVKAG